MNFQNLEYFIATANEGNISRAAESMHISQQALSGSILRLEKELGVELFNRRPTFSLTYAGKCFLKTATEIIDLKNQGETILGDISGNTRGELKIGISHSRGQVLMPIVLSAFSKKYPHAEIYIYEDVTKHLEDALEKGTIDIMIGFIPVMVDTAIVKPLIKDRLLLVLPKTLLTEHFGKDYMRVCDKYNLDHDISVFKDFPFVLLQEGERIRNIVDGKLSEKHIRPKLVAETYNIQTAYGLAAEGVGITVYPELYLKSQYTPGIVGDDRLIILPLSSDDVYDTIGIAYNRERYLSKMAKDFIDTCSETIK